MTKNFVWNNLTRFKWRPTSLSKRSKNITLTSCLSTESSWNFV